jgi:hypothetical protein
MTLHHHRGIIWYYVTIMSLRQPHHDHPTSIEEVERSVLFATTQINYYLTQKQQPKKTTIMKNS